MSDYADAEFEDVADELDEVVRDRDKIYEDYKRINEEIVGIRAAFDKAWTEINDSMLKGKNIPLHLAVRAIVEKSKVSEEDLKKAYNNGRHNLANEINSRIQGLGFSESTTYYVIGYCDAVIDDTQ